MTPKCSTVSFFPHACSVLPRVERQSRYEPSETAADENDAKTFDLDEADHTPHYQRVYISGEETASVSIVMC